MQLFSKSSGLAFYFTDKCNVEISCNNIKVFEYNSTLFKLKVL